MKENTIATNFEPHEYVIFVQSTKIGTHKNKAIHSTLLEYWKYTVFRTFLLHALTYWAEILHMTLFNCTTDQVWVLSIRINFCRSNAPFATYNTGNTQLYTCNDKFRWNLKFHVGFFNAFLLRFRQVLYKNSLLKCSWRAYYALFAVLRYI